MMGLLVLLTSHKGDEEIARLADDLDLEIDEILPAVEYAVVLGLLAVSDGRAKLTDIGRKLLAGTISGRKAILRERMERTTLFRALLRALESSPERRLTDDQVDPAGLLHDRARGFPRPEYHQLGPVRGDVPVRLGRASSPALAGEAQSERPVPSNPASLRTGADEAPGHPREHPRERRTPRRAARHVRLTVSDTFARENA